MQSTACASILTFGIFTDANKIDVGGSFVA
jgi:hypothetical protein